MCSCQDQSQLIYLQHSVYDSEGTLQKRELKDCERQRVREFVMRLCLLGMSTATPIKSCQDGCLNMS